MKRFVCCTTVLVVALPLMLFTVSCTKNVVQPEPVTMTEPEPQKTPEMPPEEPKQAMQVEEPLAPEVTPPAPPKMEFPDRNIHFEFDSYALSEQARQTLNTVADYLRTSPGTGITIEGHCDNRGTDEYNLALGERRAAAAKSFLVDLGIASDRLNTMTYGEERPIAMGLDEVSWAKNRRAEFVMN